MSALPGNSTRYFWWTLALTVAITLVGFTLRPYSSSLTCDSSLQGAGYFMGYCETTSFGDYEHGAIAYNLEPGFAENVRRADVLFLGESRMQTAASTTAVHDYFAAKGLRFYAFGFGFGETAPFAFAMLEKIDAHPAAVIINADGFFSDTMSVVADEIMGGDVLSRLKAFVDYLPKDIFEATQKRLCTLAGRLCTYAPPPRSWFRSLADGHWVWINGDPDRVARQITAARDKQNDATNLDRQREVARRLLPLLKLDPACIILTGVPNPLTQAEDAATSLATMLNLPIAQPVMEGLAIRDDSHLNRRSADRWSAALMQAVDPLLDRCRATNRP